MAGEGGLSQDPVPPSLNQRPQEGGKQNVKNPPTSDMGDEQLLPHPAGPQLGVIFLPSVFGGLQVWRWE